MAGAPRCCYRLAMAHEYLHIARRANVAQALLLAASALLPTLAASGPRKRRVETQKCVRHDSRCEVILALLLGCRIAVELGADGVGEVVVAAAVGVYGPEHGADHAGVAGWLAQLVLGPGGSLARDDVVHRLADDLWRCVSGEETNGNLISRHRWEELLGIASHVEPVQQEFCHGGVIFHGAGLIDLAIETFKRRRIVTLHIDKGEDVADGVRDRQIGAELAAITGVAGGYLRAFGDEADHEAGAETIAHLAQGRDQVHDRWRGGVLKVPVSGIDGERRAFEIDVDAVEAVLGDDARDRGDEVRNPLAIGEREVLTAATEGNHDLFALALQVANVALELCGIQSGGCLQLHGPFRCILIRCRESYDDDVPLGRDLAEREGGTRGAVTGPVADEPMAVRRAAHRDRRYRGLRRRRWTTARARTPTPWRARLGRVGERLRVWEAVSTAETLKGARVPGQQCHVLQVIGGSVQMGDKGLRCGDIVLGVRICGLQKEIGGGDARATAATLVSRTHPTGQGVSWNFDVTAVEQGVV